MALGVKIPPEEVTGFRRTDVTPVRVEWLCPVVGCTGTMSYDATTYKSSITGVTRYNHLCDVCGYYASIEQYQYPFIEYDEIS